MPVGALCLEQLDAWPPNARESFGCESVALEAAKGRHHCDGFYVYPTSRLEERRDAQARTILYGVRLNLFTKPAIKSSKHANFSARKLATSAAKFVFRSSGPHCMNWDELGSLCRELNTNFALT